MLLKGNLARKSWPIDAVVGVDWRGRGSDSLGIYLGSWIGAEWATISLQTSHDRATIAPRSGHDRASIVILVLNRSSSDSVEGLWHCWWSGVVVIVWWSWPQFCDKSAPNCGIGPRSNRDRESWSWVLLRRCRSMKIRRCRESHTSPRWDEDLGRLMEIARSQCIHATPTIAKDLDRPHCISNRERSRPSDEATCDRDVFDLMKIKRSSQRHVSSGTPFARRHLKYILRTCLIWWSHGLGSTLSPPSWPNPCPSCVHVTCKR